MLICERCKLAILWASLSEDEKRASGLIAPRPSRFGDVLTFDHNSSLEDLQRSSDDCFLCLSLAKSAEGESTSLAVKLVQRRRNRSLAFCFRPEFWRNDTAGGTSGYTFPLRGPYLTGICSSTTSIPSTNISADLYPGDLAKRAIWSGETSAFETRVPLLLDWLRSCQQGHPQCAESGVSVKPARFVDVSRSSSGQVKVISSRDVNTSNPSFRYIALSHCWGIPSPETPLLRTTTSTYAAHANGRELQQLPTTFRDAVTVATALDVDYLWIDSLCIIQDDALDWSIEASKMAHVYQGSYVTIAATSSPDSRGGLFLDILSPAIKVEGQINEEGREIACCMRHPVAARSDIWTSPLCQRAWVLQEQILSRRLVHFTKEQMFFQCHGRLESEDGTISDTEFNSLRGSATSAEGETGMGIRDFDSPLQARKTWWSWVTEYSARSLTFRSDRMAAFAGIVKRYEDRMAQVPLLGLWKETIWYDLGWFVDVKHDNEQRAGDNESNIPTWSWLCVQPSKIVSILTELDNKKLAEFHGWLTLVDSNVTWEGPAYSSKLLSSQLVVRAPIKPLGFPLPDARGGKPLRVDFEPPWDEFLGITLYLDAPLDRDKREGLILTLLYSGPIYEFYLVLEQDSIGDESTMPTYRRIGAGDIHRPRGRAGFFEGSDPKTFEIR